MNAGRRSQAVVLASGLPDTGTPDRSFNVDDIDDAQVRSWLPDTANRSWCDDAAAPDSAAELIELGMIVGPGFVTLLLR